MTCVIRIDPDGTVTELADTDILAAAWREWPPYGAEVVTLRGHGTPGNTEMLVGAVAEYGTLDGLAVNPKAWALYGRSAIHGPMYVAFDGHEDGTREPLPAGWIAKISGNEWLDGTFYGSVGARP